MFDIIKSIYDMMGKCTYPMLKEETPHQHVEIFFQVRLTFIYFVMIVLHIENIC